jgi:LacI family transcriptional regulator
MALKTHRVALLFNGNKVFDREVITGIAEYLSSTRTQWDLFLEEDFRLRLQGIEHWQGDGIIADFDDPAVADTLAQSRVPLVAVGGSYENENDYPANVSYVATDNYKIVKLAYEHLIDSGLRNFALFSLPAAPGNRWAQEREKAFAAMLRRDRAEPAVFRGQCTRALRRSGAGADRVAAQFAQADRNHCRDGRAGAATDAGLYPGGDRRARAGCVDRRR